MLIVSRNTAVEIMDQAETDKQAVCAPAAAK